MIAVPIETEENELMVLEVLRQLRRESVIELTATRLEATETAALTAFAAELRQLRPHALMRFAFCDTNLKPIAVFNVYRAGAVEVQFQMFSTNGWSLIAGWMVRWIRNQIMPRLVELGIEVGDITALVAHRRVELDRWFAMLDCFPCGPALPRGRNGELYQHYVWRAPALPRRKVEALVPYGVGEGDLGSVPL